MSIHYKTNKISFKDKLKICKEAYSANTKWWIDELDCRKSFQRQKIEMEFEEALSKFSSKDHFFFVYRNYDWEDYGEIGFSSMLSPTYFLWIYVTTETLNSLRIKWNIESY